jgi:hypothetical protein
MLLISKTSCIKLAELDVAIHELPNSANFKQDFVEKWFWPLYQTITQLGQVVIAASVGAFDRYLPSDYVGQAGHTQNIPAVLLWNTVGVWLMCFVGTSEVVTWSQCRHSHHAWEHHSEAHRQSLLKYYADTALSRVQRVNKVGIYSRSIPYPGPITLLNSRVTSIIPSPRLPENRVPYQLILKSESNAYYPQVQKSQDDKL